jgi:hypothetical protein
MHPLSLLAAAVEAAEAEAPKSLKKLLLKENQKLFKDINRMIIKLQWPRKQKRLKNVKKIISMVKEKLIN